MTDDIVERLRRVARMYPQWGEVAKPASLAADEIEQLRADVSDSHDIEVALADEIGVLVDENNQMRAEIERLRAVIVTAIEHLDNCCWYDAEAALQAALTEQENDR